ncbi:MAG: aminotransferase class V-fold PLP-dependent enzyme [Actinobacteria bacterium]|nr:aminotransferase class V-fold PLP-dependent enzyme [Actinomycetota bacterium]
MVRVTGNFQSESPLHPKAFDVLHAAFDSGWADPAKLSQSGAKARQVKNNALESIASSLSVGVDSIVPVSPTSLGYFLGIQGLFVNTPTLIHGATDRKDVFAIAAQTPHHIFKSSLDGKLIPENDVGKPSVLALQIANAETGVVQECDAIIASTQSERIFLDATTSGIRVRLPDQFSTALFDSKSWYGPAELGILIIKKPSQWSNPLPHLNAAHPNFDVSLPLLLASAVALENFSTEVQKADTQARTYNQELRSAFSQVADTDIAGSLDSSLAHMLSVSFMNCNGEELLRAIHNDGYSVDSGSACTADDLQPSHVLAAMGVLTHGNIRITIHPGTTQEEIDGLINSVVSNVNRSRA